MKRVRLTPQAVAALDGILEFSIRRWGEAQAEAYRAQLIDRLKALAAGAWPRARSCAVLFRGEPDEERLAGLRYSREGAHYLIFRETADELIVFDMLHASMDLERHIGALAAHDRDVNEEGNGER